MVLGYPDPVSLGGISVTLSPLWVLAAFTTIAQGISVGCSVYINQLGKQAAKVE